jgi:DNA invertase Pin-like site-specific DNA recombinase
MVNYPETSSGTIPFDERTEGKKVLKDAANKRLTELYVHSIDRLGRNALDVLKTIQALTEYGVNLRSEKEGLQTLVNGKENPTAKLIINILASVSEMERTMLRERQKEGIEAAKKKGKYKGRRVGSSIPEERYLKKYANVVKELKEGESIRRAAKVCSVSVSTVQKVSMLMG